ncbi:MAG: septum formation family protein [Actinomycetota bacterium]|nr:septum formation family protein [Actinomycetota bacterium]
MGPEARVSGMRKVVPAWGFAMEPKPHRALRAIAVEVGGVLLIVAALVVSFGATYVRDSKHLVPGFSTAADVPGTCHNDQDYFEVELTSAELTPPVPCTRPHTSEVLWTVQLTGRVAQEHNRPTPEMLAPQYRRLCQLPQRLAAYVGENPNGFLYNISLDIRYPSAPEWRAGVRIARCIAGPFYHTTFVTRPTFNFPLAGSWTREDSAAIRLCATIANKFVPCDQPHTQEVLEPVDPFPATQIAVPPPALAISLGMAPCTKEVLALIGRSKLPNGSQVVVEPPDAQSWPVYHAVGCRFQFALRIGSVAAGLT